MTVAAFTSFDLLEGRQTGSDVAFHYFLILTAAAAFITNSCSNIYLLEKYYPDGHLPGPYLKLIALALFLSSIVITLMTLGYAQLLYDILAGNSDKDDFSLRSRIITAAFGMILLITYYVTWQQVALRRIIQRNHRRLYNAFLESNQK